MKRGAPLARTGFKRKQTDPFKTTFHAQTLMRKAAIKTKKKRVTVAEGSKYLAACRGETCWLGILGVCIGGTSTVVPCHSNQSRHGKGLGIKAKHEFTVPGCMACHSWIDTGLASREAKFGAWDEAYARWKPARDCKLGIVRETEHE